jgi:sugar transferase (PEP-CTERM/EpsH1 system associated)
MAQFLFSPELRTIPSVLDMVDVDSAKWAALAATLSGPRRWVFAREARVLRRFEGAAAAHARATLVVNERERDALLPIAPAARIITVPNGIDSGFFAPTAPPAPSAGVVFCGVMDYEPNVRGAVWLAREVWPHVRSQRPDARLIIVGSNPAHAVATLADDRGAITVTGGVDDVRPHLWQAAVAVAPLLVARGLQNKVLEGLAAGLPAVVTPQVEEGLPAAVRAGCRTAADPTAFAAHIVSLLSLTPDDRRRLALAAQVERLDWRSTLQPAIELVKELAAYAR